ncbi:MAG: hypothetical protein E7277_01730 [Lachnospiraceae bacterium]|nr:hypothetical protein [Lachnospiraceae bacterium]
MKFGKIIVGIGILVCVGACAVGCQKKAEKKVEKAKNVVTSEKEDTTTFTVWVENSLEKKPFEVMVEKGYDKEGGFQLQFSESSMPEEGLKDGKIQVIAGEYADVFLLQEQDIDARIIGNVTNDLVLLATADSQITNMAQMKDEEVWHKKDSDAYALSYLLAQANYRNDYVKNREAASYEQIVKAMESGEAKLAILPKPYADKMLEAGAVCLAASSESRFCDRCLLASFRAINEQKALFEAFGKAYEQAVNDLAATDAQVEYSLLVQPEDEVLYDVYLYSKDLWNLRREYQRKNLVQTITAGEDNE